jgi:hypothetical protein
MRNALPSAGSSASSCPVRVLKRRRVIASKSYGSLMVDAVLHVAIYMILTSQDRDYR